MKKQSGGRFADTMIVRPNSWHGRAYRFWQRHAQYKNHPNYRENLCHYSRVVLIWAPLTVAKLLISYVFELFEPILDVAYDIGHSIGAFIGRHGGSWLGRGLDSFSYWFEKTILRSKGSKRKSYGWGERLGNLWVIGVVFIAPIALIVWAIMNPMHFLMYAAATAGMIAAGAAIVFGALWLNSRNKAKTKHKTPSTPVRDTIQLAGHMIVAKKRGICPYIVLESDEPIETEVPAVEIIAKEAPPSTEFAEKAEERELVPV